MRLADYRAVLYTSFGNQSLDSNIVTLFDQFVNDAYEEAIRVAGVTFWTRRYQSYLTVPRVTQTGASGVASVTGGSRNLTLAAASRIDRRYIGAMMKIASAAESYLITDIRTPTSIVIDPPFSGAAFGTTLTNQDVTIAQANYRLPPDLIQINVVKQSNTPLRLFAVQQRMLDEWTPDPLLLGESGRPEVYLIIGSGGLPPLWGSKAQRTITAGAAGGQVTTLNNDIRVSDGTVTADLLDNALLTTNGGTAANSILRGFHVRVAGDREFYKIRDVIDAGGVGVPVRLHLDVPFNGAAATDAEYIIGPSEPGWIRLYPLPDTQLHVDMEYYALPSLLRNADDEPVLPRDLHQVITTGAKMYVADYTQNMAAHAQCEKAFDAGLVRIQQATKGTGDLVYRFRSRPRMERWGDGLVSPRIPNVVSVS